MKYTARKILVGLGIASVAGFGIYTDHYMRDSRYTVRGELIRDSVEKIAGIHFYRIWVMSEEGMVNYRVLSFSEPVDTLDKNYISREESGTRGDFVGINPESGAFLFGQVLLNPENIIKID